VSLLNKGGSAFFSVACQNAILDLGWHPDEFGTYKSTAKYLDQCRKKVAKGESCTPREEALGQPTFLDPPTNSQKNPQAYQSGHMYMDSTMRQPGMRGNPCGNRVPGYEENLCPAMPHGGMTTQAGGQHQRHAAREYADGLPPNGERDGGRYGGAATDAEARAKCHADAQARARALCAERREEIAQAGQPGSGGTTAAPSTAAERDAAAAASGAQPGSAAEPSIPKDEQIDGNSAEECLEKFVTAAFAGMQKECENNAPPPGTVVEGGEPADDAEIERRFRAMRSSQGSLGNAKRWGGDVETAQGIFERDRAAYEAAKSGGSEQACRDRQGMQLRGDEGVTGPNCPGQPGNSGSNVPGSPNGSTSPPGSVTSVPY
jgi:hypothetical protein